MGFRGSRVQIPPSRLLRANAAGTRAGGVFASPRAVLFVVLRYEATRRSRNEEQDLDADKMMQPCGVEAEDDVLRDVQSKQQHGEYRGRTQEIALLHRGRSAGVRWCRRISPARIAANMADPRIA